MVLKQFKVLHKNVTRVTSACSCLGSLGELFVHRLYHRSDLEVLPMSRIRSFLVKLLRRVIETNSPKYSISVRKAVVIYANNIVSTPVVLHRSSTVKCSTNRGGQGAVIASGNK